MSEEKEYATIYDMFSGYIHNKNVRVFHFKPFEMQSASQKKPAWFKISIPRDIVNTNLKDAYEWAFIGVAIPKIEIEFNDEKAKEEDILTTIPFEECKGCKHNSKNEGCIQGRPKGYYVNPKLYDCLEEE